MTVISSSMMIRTGSSEAARSTTAGSVLPFWGSWFVLGFNFQLVVPVSNSNLKASLKHSNAQIVSYQARYPMPRSVSCEGAYACTSNMRKNAL
jgi:hypothetical protein